MFQLNKEEYETLKSQIVISSGEKKDRSTWGGRRKLPYAFTEQGVAMLSGILNSKQAIETNIAIMRTFVALRHWIESNKALAEKIRQLEKKYDQRFKLVFDTIQQLIRQEKEAHPIGFKIGKAQKK